MLLSHISLHNLIMDVLELLTCAVRWLNSFTPIKSVKLLQPCWSSCKWLNSFLVVNKFNLLHLCHHVLVSYRHFGCFRPVWVIKWLRAPDSRQIIGSIHISCLQHQFSATTKNMTLWSHMVRFWSALISVFQSLFVALGWSPVKSSAKPPVQVKSWTI